jgi:hypothetical protein
VLRLTGNQYLVVGAGRDGWIPSETLAVRFRLVDGPRVELQDEADPECRAVV